MCEPYTDPETGVSGIRCPNAMGAPGKEGPTGFAGRFVLEFNGSSEEGDWGYCTSWNTFEEATVAFEPRKPVPGGPCETTGCGGDLTPRIPAGFRLTDQETGRVWNAGDAAQQ